MAEPIPAVAPSAPAAAIPVVEGGLPGCGNAGTGDCCAATGTPFCEDADCCSRICTADAFCCDTEWDQICADAASAACTGCGANGPPANDECGAAIPILLGATAVSNANASGATAACDKFGSPNIFNDIWYAFVAEADGWCTVSFCGAAAWDTKIAAFDACGGDLVACNDDACDLASEMAFIARAGSTYLLGIGSYGARGFGSGMLVISLEPGCVGPDCDGNGACDADELASGAAADCNGNVVIDACDIASGFESDVDRDGIPDSCQGPIGDLNGDGLVTASDFALLLTAWGMDGANPADLDGDGVVGAGDIAILLDNWGASG